MTQLFNLPKAVPLSTAGDLIPGAKLYFYQTGTTTPQNVYTDIGLSVAHSSPVEADASGVFAPIYLDHTLPNYRVKLTDSAGTQIWQLDDIPASTLTGENTFSATQYFTKSGTASAAIVLTSATPVLEFKETGAAANNARWLQYADGEVFYGSAKNDANSSEGVWVQVNRTGAVIDSVALPTTTTGSFLVGLTAAVQASRLAHFYAPTGSNVASLFKNDGGAGAQTIDVWNAASSGDNVFVAFLTESGFTSRGTISYNRGGGLVAYNTSSDARLKTNIVDAPQAGDLIDAIKVRSFDWIDGPHVDHWVVAQELYEVAPNAVSKGDDGPTIEKQWAVDPSKLIPLLIKEIQDLRARVAALE